MILSTLFAAALALADRPAAVVPVADQAAYKAWLADQAIEAEAAFSLKPRCSDAAVRDIATTTGPLAKPPPGVRATALAESLTVEGCGRRMRVNIGVLAPLQGQGWQARTGIPGDSLAGYGLQQQAAHELQAVLAGRVSATCVEVGFGEAEVVARPGGVHLLAVGSPPPKATPGIFYSALKDPTTLARIAQDQAWAERWPLSACGVDASVVILFGPIRDSDQIYMSISPGWTAAK
ncbi:hypothetical protein [Phenylobacterium sp.]|uniref:hypothetical protein n=1 Tax=Phenylobacterium sp. TaxID=1871053 RepID=UPI0025DC966B|nr:hypothetical protein [Phenylobacterium sp.]